MNHSAYPSVFRPGLFSGRTIVVTGGGTGLGRCIARELAALGAHVVLAARTPDPLKTTASEIEACGGSASWRSCNIRREEEVAALFAWVREERGAVDGLVNNAGGQFVSPAEDISQKGWHAVVETCLTGTFLCCREAYRASMRERGGSIVNVVSEMWRGFPGMAHSGAARAGVVNLTKTLAVEWAHAGVRVNALAPGLIRTTGLQKYGEALQPFLEEVARDVPAKRMGTEAEVSAAATFLLSPAAAYVTGATLCVDGGGSLWRKTWSIEDHEGFPPFEGFAPE
ncbi:MAG: SDR family oxidoreductase [Planctomycetota bacterium]|nr:MAG: SDR family oxidoreductase [Planctomycetota bacterium]